MKSKNVSYDSILNRILDEREGKEVDSAKSEACVLLSHIIYDDNNNQNWSSLQTADVIIIIR